VEAYENIKALYALNSQKLKYMKSFRIFFVFCLWIYSFQLYSQETVSPIGEVHYSFIVHFGKHPEPPINTTLLFGKSESSFFGSQIIEENSKDKYNADSTKSEINLLKSFEIYVQKDYSSRKMHSTEYVLSKRFYVKDTLQNLQWELGTNNKTIGKFMCQNAFVNFRGRKYEAWFCSDIPVPSGPWKLHGLPGLILEAKDSTGEVHFAFESIHIPTEKTSFMRLSNISSTIEYTDYSILWKKKIMNLTKQLKSSNSSAQNGFDINVNLGNFKLMEYIE
jgi:GLPGLI family protein